MKVMKKNNVRFCRRVRKTPKFTTKEIVAIIMMILGFVGCIFSLAQAYFMTYPEYYSQYIFMNMDAIFGVSAVSLAFFITGIKLPTIS